MDVDTRISKRRSGRLGRPHLGDRVVITAALYPAELSVIDEVRGRAGRSQFLAEILTEHVGRSDLLPKPTQLAVIEGYLPNALKRLAAQARAVAQTGAPAYVTVRVHPAVRAELDLLRQGLPMAVWTATVIRERLGLAGADSPTRQEGLPLAM